MAGIVLPNATIGILGGSQIGRMLALSAKKLGFKVGILDPDNFACAKNVADFFVQAEFTNTEEVKKFAEKCDVITYETSDVNIGVLRTIARTIDIPQNLDLLQITQNRLLEKTFLDEKDLISAPFKTIIKAVEINEGIAEIGLPCVLKSVHTDKKCTIYSMKDAARAMDLLRDGSCVLEAWIPAEYELSVQVCGNKKGEYSVFPVVEVLRKGKEVHQVLAPARIDKEASVEAKRIALEIAEALELVGAMTIEMFQTKEGGIYVHQLIARPSNLGLYTLEACTMDQFEMHLRAICGWPLGEVSQLSDAVMVKILAQEYYETQELIQDKPDWHFHYYGKNGVKKGWKMGHITVLTDDMNQALEEIYQTKIWD